jgi:ABC-2 type transport system permease protein
VTTVDIQGAPGSAPGGVIHDIGYQRYDGPRLGRPYIFGSLYLHGLRAAFGFGRSAKAKVFPWLLVAVIGMVAVVLTVIQSQTGRFVLSYAEFPQELSLLIVFFCAIVAPELVSRDLHSGALPLYFARPLHRSDYALAKLAAMISAAFLIMAGPLTLMFAGAAFSVDKFSKVWGEAGDWLVGLGHVAVHVVAFASVAVLVAALIRRRAVASGAIVGVFLLSTPVFGVLSVLPSRTANELAGLTSPMTLVSGVCAWLFGSDGEFDIGGFGPLYGLVALVLVIGCVLLLLARYRKVATR